MSDAVCDRMIDTIVVAAINEGRAGSAEALGTLFDKYRDYLITVAGERLTDQIKSKVSPSDLVQNIFRCPKVVFPSY